MTAENSQTALNYIDGRWVDTDDHRPSHDPATGRQIGTFACASRAHTEQAINAAKRSFAGTQWRHDARLRARVLNSMADAVDAHRDQLIEALALENGKIVPEATFEVSMVAPKFRWWAAMALTTQGRAADLGQGRTSLVLREPVGVAGVIVPFNSPIILATRSLGPALAAGTTAVVKFPEETALVNSLFFKILVEADPDLPTGVLNMVNTDRDGGSVIVESPDVPVISFTGSTATGRAISATGAAHLKRFSLELGGMSPMILFEDADIEAALPVLTHAITTFAGQFCMAGSRLLVHRSVADTVRDQMSERLANVRVGAARDPKSEMGPMIDKANVARVDGIVEAAITAGARVLTRGGIPTDAHLADGAFYLPTLLEVSDQSAPVIQKETFGPVLTLQVFDTEPEAVALANGTEYGLAASVWTRDVDRSLRVARALESGTVWINNWAAVYDEFEEGGYKSSGVGRLNGLAALEDFLEYKHIAFSTKRPEGS